MKMILPIVLVLIGAVEIIAAVMDTNMPIMIAIILGIIFIGLMWDRTDGSHVLYKGPASGGCGRSCPPKCVPDNIHSAPDTGPLPAIGLPIH